MAGLDARSSRASAALRRLVAPALVGASLAVSSTALAADDTEEAAHRFQEGTRAFGRRDFRAAARAFDEANARAPRGATLVNAGQAWQAAGERAIAADRFFAALRTGELSKRRAEEIQAKLRELERRLGVLQLTAPEGARVSIAHVNDEETPLRIHLAPGTHQATVVVGARQASRLLAVEAGSEVTVFLDVDPAPVEKRDPSLSLPARQDRNSTTAGTTQRVLGWSSIGLGAALAGTAVGLGLSALSARDDYEASNRTDRDRYDEATTLRTWTNVAWAGAAVAVAAGVVLVLTAPNAGRSSVASPSPRPVLMFW